MGQKAWYKKLKYKNGIRFYLAIYNKRAYFVYFTWELNLMYRQPGLLCTPRNFAQSSTFLGKKKFFGTKVTFEAFLSISQNLKVTRLQGGTQTKLWTCLRNFDLSRSFEHFLGLFMASLCFSRWSDQKCCKTECVALKPSFQTRPNWVP